MFLDEDIKIVGDKPSIDVKKNLSSSADSQKLSAEIQKKAEQWGRDVALEFIADANENPLSEEIGNDILIQRRLLISFTATVGFEEYAPDDSVTGIAQKSFLDTLKQKDEDLYKTSTDTGAFSFYYLVFRRGFDLERRMGQTFAMLCSHDGDPIYQELGEALYCWFLSVVKKSAEGLNI
ncbi:MAG: hypothetical protein J6A78_03715 [Clostridia bacterium]|nr:hypothetical protein [Clostridia bacterium]